MKPFDHLKGSCELWYYQSPPAHRHAPRVIEQGIEEIEVIVSGYGLFDLGGAPVRVGPGGMAWYQPGDTVTVTSDEAEPYETIVFRFHVCPGGIAGESRPASYAVWQNPADCEAYCRRMLELHRKHESRSAEETLCHYARLRWEAMESNRAGRDLEKPLAVQRAIRWIEDRYLDPLTLPRIAEAAGVSPSHLFTLFRTHVGASPAQCVIRLRIQKARELLTTTLLSVKQVCAESGFSDMKYFCSRFKRETGTTPTGYRQRHSLPFK